MPANTCFSRHVPFKHGPAVFVEVAIPAPTPSTSLQSLQVVEEVVLLLAHRARANCLAGSMAALVWSQHCVYRIPQSSWKRATLTAKAKVSAHRPLLRRSALSAPPGTRWEISDRSGCPKRGFTHGTTRSLSQRPQFNLPSPKHFDSSPVPSNADSELAPSCGSRRDGLAGHHVRLRSAGRLQLG